MKKLIKILKPIVQKFPALANLYRSYHESRIVTAKVLFRDKLGFFFNGMDIMHEGKFEPDETYIFDKIISNYDMFVNVGANTGYYVCKALKEEINVVAFEPSQLNVTRMVNNIQANNFNAEFQLFPIALSNQLGLLPIYGEGSGASLLDGWAGGKYKSLVPVSSYDMTAMPLTENKKCLVMIDIEGAELGCLKGANSLIASDQDNDFIIEICSDVHQPQGTIINPNLVETFQLMFSYGYSAYTADANLRKIELSEAKEIESTQINTLETHNFIFSKTDNIINKLKS
ncbi:FkbM family methyltransferase [Gammaproteobacteria bacterium]|nr:FkbM family methyltransferase [Gammaproteobacteria bacterium]